MSLPTPEKTWQYAHQTNTVGATLLESYQKALLSIVNAMISFPSRPWVVVASSNGVVANSSNNWNSPSDLVFSAAGACSWMLLSQPGIADNYQLLLSCRVTASTSGDEMRTSASHVGGYTPLNSTTTVPAAPVGSEYAVSSPVTYWFDVFGAAFASVCHVMMSTDGSITNWILTEGGYSKAFHSFFKMADPVTGITDPSLMVRIGGAPPASSVLLSTYLTGFHNFVAGAQAGTVSRYFLSSEAINALLGRTAERKNIVSGEYIINPLGATCDTNTIEGRHCSLRDIWYGATDVLVPDGTGYPSDGTAQFRQFGDVVFPWDGTAVPGMVGAAANVDGYLAGFSDPASPVVNLPAGAVQALDGMPQFLGVLTSSGSAVNNATTANPFNQTARGPVNFSGTLAGKRLMLQTSAAGFVLPAATTALTIANQTLPTAMGHAPGTALGAGDRIVIDMLPNWGFLQWLPESAGNLFVWELAQ